MKHSLTLFIFRRDLRLDDNTGLMHALKNSQRVIPCFILDPRQIRSANKYRSLNAMQFMAQSLTDLDQQLKARGSRLYLFNGKPDVVIKKLFSTLAIEALYLNRDYTPFSIKRDKQLAILCKRNDVEFHSFDDVLLVPPQDTATASSTPYKVYSAFYKQARKHSIAQPHANRKTNYATKRIPGLLTTAQMEKKLITKPNKNLHVHGGTTQARKLLRLLSHQKQYAQTRDYPAHQTTNLSAHLKFGTISIRHAYHAIKKKLGPSHLLIKELFWRDFFTYVLFHFPHVLGHAFNPRYDRIRWKKDVPLFKRWCVGTTGFPIVDAGMRQLNTTGFMHNRVRMIVASFLTKDLHINWQDGERYFAQQLVDYDPAVNNGNWQWASSTGVDAQPYFRIFNPWTQQKKFDPQSEYIKQWIPELKNIDSKIINNWFKNTHGEISNYPRPCVDHNVERKKALMYFKRVLGKK